MEKVTIWYELTVASLTWQKGDREKGEVVVRRV